MIWSLTQPLKLFAREVLWLRRVFGLVPGSCLDIRCWRPLGVQRLQGLGGAGLHAKRLESQGPRGRLRGCNLRTGPNGADSRQVGNPLARIRPHCAPLARQCNPQESHLNPVIEMSQDLSAIGCCKIFGKRFGPSKAQKSPKSNQ